MDMLTMFTGALASVWYLAPLLLMAFLFKTRWFKGVIGEFAVNCSAKLLLDKNQYHLIKNVILLTDDGSTQIDHVIVSRFGVFVVETKNMKGWIFGGENQPTWTQKIYRHSNKFQNPLRQNYKHVKTLQSLLGLADHQVFSVIVFVGENTFKSKMPDNVAKGGGYVRYIKSKQTLVLTPAEVQDITQILSRAGWRRLSKPTVSTSGM